MPLLLYILVFIVGLCLGSFINVLISRLGRRGGILNGRSECPHCRHRLSWQDLIPIFSYVFLSGRCRYCQEKISWIYPVVEITAGILFLAFFTTHSETLIQTVLNFQSSYLVANSILEILFKLFLVGVLISLLFFDAKHFILPDIIIFPSLIITIAFSLIFLPGKFSNLFITSLALGGLFAIIYIVSKGKWVGFGDSKFLFLIGLVFGYPIGVLILFVAIWLAAIYGLILLALKKASPKTPIPFGSFLAFASLLALIFENELAQIIRYF